MIFNKTDNLTLSAIKHLVLSDHAQLELLMQQFDKEADRINKRFLIADKLNRSDRKPLERRIKALVDISRSISKLRASIYDTETVPHI